MKIRLPQRKVQISFRIPEDMKTELDDAGRLWRLTAKVEGKDPEDVNETFVGTEVIDEGLRSIWADVGRQAGLPLDPEQRYPGKPVTEEDWAKVETIFMRAAQVKPDHKRRK